MVKLKRSPKNLELDINVSTKKTGKSAFFCGKQQIPRQTANSTMWRENQWATEYSWPWRWQKRNKRIYDIRKAFKIYADTVLTFSAFWLCRGDLHLVRKLRPLNVFRLLLPQQRTPLLVHISNQLHTKLLNHSAPHIIASMSRRQSNLWKSIQQSPKVYDYTYVEPMVDWGKCWKSSQNCKQYCDVTSATATAVTTTTPADTTTTDTDTTTTMTINP